MTGFVIVGAVGLAVMVACFVAVIHTARGELAYANEEIERLRRDRDYWQGQATAEDDPHAEVTRLRAALHVQAAENASLRKRLAQAWDYANAPEADDAPTQDAA